MSTQIPLAFTLADTVPPRCVAYSLFRGDPLVVLDLPLSDVNTDFISPFGGFYISSTCFLHLGRLLNKARVTKLGLLYACWSFWIGENISWPNMDVTLPFWVIMRPGRRNVMNHIAMKGGPYLVVGVRGILLPWVILQRERHHDHIWISIFLWHQFRGVGLCPYMAYGRGLSIYGSLHGFLGWLKCPLPYYLHILYIKRVILQLAYNNCYFIRGDVQSFPTILTLHRKGLKPSLSKSRSVN
jgi:hypothetical protein